MPIRLTQSATTCSLVISVETQLETARVPSLALNSGILAE
jgi:hypothetical protein